MYFITKNAPKFWLLLPNRTKSRKHFYGHFHRPLALVIHHWCNLGIKLLRIALNPRGMKYSIQVYLFTSTSSAYHDIIRLSELCIQLMRGALYRRQAKVFQARYAILHQPLNSAKLRCSSEVTLGILWWKEFSVRDHSRYKFNIKHLFESVFF